MVTSNSTWSLSVECSTSFGSLFLINNQDPSLSFESQWVGSQSHSEVLTEKARALFHQATASMNFVTDVFCGCGPGSFTGIRVAVNFARALAYANHTPITTVDTLSAVAFGQKHPAGRVYSVCYAFRDLVYWRSVDFDDNGLILNTSEPKAETIEQFLSHINTPGILAGPGAEKIKSASVEASRVFNFISETHPTAKDVFECAKSQPEHYPTKAWKTAKPLYIRASEAEEKLRTGVLKPQKKL